MLTKSLIALSLALMLGSASVQVAAAQQASGSRVHAIPRISEPEYLKWEDRGNIEDQGGVFRR